MTLTLSLFGALALFLVGLRLSAFFSGSETGFYRISFLRVTIDAESGDKAAKKIQWFAQNPGYFVATTLVGNNVANYVTTMAISLILAVASVSHSGWMEIVATLLVSPLIFVFGELLPKNLYYRAPLQLMRRDIHWFALFYRLFLVASFPLIGIAKWFERLSSLENRPRDLVLGKNRLVQVFSEGQHAGLLTDVQSRLGHGVMALSTQRLGNSVTPTDRVLGVAEVTSREEMLAFARKYGISSVALHRKEAPHDWFGYVRVLDILSDRRVSLNFVRTMPEIAITDSRLDAMLTLYEEGVQFGVVKDGEVTVGVVSAHGLSEQMFRAGSTPGTNLGL